MYDDESRPAPSEEGRGRQGRCLPAEGWLRRKDIMLTGVYAQDEKKSFWIVVLSATSISMWL